MSFLLIDLLALHRHRSQKSASVYLRRGRVYLIEALMIDAGGPDHLSVGVKIPRGGYQRPISNRDLYVIPPGKIALKVLLPTLLKKDLVLNRQLL